MPFTLASFKWAHLHVLLVLFLSGLALYTFCLHRLLNLCSHCVLRSSQFIFYKRSRKSCPRPFLFYFSQCLSFNSKVSCLEAINRASMEKSKMMEKIYPSNTDNDFINQPRQRLNGATQENYIGPTIKHLAM